MLSQNLFSTLYGAFSSDGFRVKKVAHTESGRLGIMAEHRTAANYDTGKKKAAYYLEGTPYERGYLLGLLAEPYVSDMAVNFVDNIIFDLLDIEFFNLFPGLQRLVVDIVHGLSKNVWDLTPSHIRGEAKGLLDGCRKSNPDTRVTEQRIVVMNVGFDVICALAYTGNFLKEKVPEATPQHIRLAMMCNAFTVLGDAAGGGHYFGRDFMFATATTLQNNIAHMVISPESGEGRAEKLLPYVSVTAPGLIGSISAMNINGVAAGLNMSPAANCDTQRIGLNSLLLLRECVMRGESASAAVGVVQNTRRGVSWNYVISDGKADTACTVEAGASSLAADLLSFPSKKLLPFLPGLDFLESHNPSPMKNGAMVRWLGDTTPDAYLKFNDLLWQYYRANHDKNIRLYPDAFSPLGFINRTPEEKNCPSSFYFAPQRTGRDVLITTNHFIMPHMRLFAMHPWCAQVAQGNINDIQWRYDELNFEITQTIQEQGSVSYEAAKRLLEFLAPYGRFPLYYKKNPKSADAKAVRIEGCYSLFDLKKRTVESHYGYYSDEWVKTTLPNYIT